MKSYLIALLAAALITYSCNQSDNKRHAKEQIVTLFNKLQKQRWKNTDSLGFYADSLYTLTKGKGGDLEAMGQFGLGNFNQKRSNYKVALSHFYAADSILANSSTDSLKAKVQNILGATHRQLGNYDISLQHYLNALRYYEKINYKDGIGGINNNLAQLYQQKGDYDDALKHADIAIKLFEDQPTHIVYLLASQSKASTYLLLNKPDSALALDSIGIGISKQTGNKVILSTFLNNKAKSFMEKGMYDSSKIYYRQSFVIDSANSDQQFMADTYLQMADMSMKEKKPAQATAYLQRSLQVGYHTGHKKTILQSWELFSEYYSQAGDYKMAMAAKDSAQYWKDLSINEKTETRLAELNTQYETDKKNDQIALQKTQLSRQKIIIVAIVAIAVLLIALAIAQLRKAEIKKQKELQLALFEQQQQAAAAVLKAEEKERGRIAADLHDGVGQTMMAAWLNLQALQDTLHSDLQQKNLFDKTMTLVDESCKEIRQVSHELMPVALQKKGLIQALEEYAQKINNPMLKVVLHSHGLERSFSSEEAFMLFRVIQECIQNVARHAQASRLDISFSENEQGLDILLEDNGTGFDPRLEKNKNGIGLQSIVSRIQYLKGTVEWDAAPGKGTLVIIQLPRL